MAFEKHADAPKEDVEPVPAKDVEVPQKEDGKQIGPGLHVVDGDNNQSSENDQ